MSNCVFCEKFGSKEIYDENIMTHHPQTGDRCCNHCAESILIEKCIFCNDYDYDKSICKIDNIEKKYDYNDCGKWNGDTSFLTC